MCSSLLHHRIGRDEQCLSTLNNTSQHYIYGLLCLVVQSHDKLPSRQLWALFYTTAKSTYDDKSLTAASNGIWIEVLGSYPLLPPWQIGGDGILRLGLAPRERSYLSACRSISVLGQTV